MPGGASIRGAHVWILFGKQGQKSGGPYKRDDWKFCSHETWRGWFNKSLEITQSAVMTMSLLSVVERGW